MVTLGYRPPTLSRQRRRTARKPHRRAPVAGSPPGMWAPSGTWRVALAEGMLELFPSSVAPCSTSVNTPTTAEIEAHATGLGTPAVYAPPSENVAVVRVMSQRRIAVRFPAETICACSVADSGDSTRRQPPQPCPAHRSGCAVGTARSATQDLACVGSPELFQAVGVAPAAGPAVGIFCAGRVRAVARCRGT